MNDTISVLYEHEIELEKLGVEVPEWIKQDIDCSQVAAILQGGCASGAYMPAVTYHEALKTMGEYGDEVLDYIEEATGDTMLTLVRAWPTGATSWAGLACYFVSLAVELWASSVSEEVVKAVEELEEEEE